jgi:hypothetical protein
MPTLDSALSNIYKYGTPKQKLIVTSLRSSSINYAIENVGGSGICYVTDSAKTQQKIDTQILNEIQALDEITIKIHPVTAQSNIGLEGTLVHESRHAYHIARAISEFSQNHNLKRQPYDPDFFTVEYAAHETYVDYVMQAIKLNHPEKQAFINESILLGVTKWVGKKLVISKEGIYKRLLSGYGYDGKSKLGGKVSDNFNLLPRGGW